VKNIKSIISLYYIQNMFLIDMTSDIIASVIFIQYYPASHKSFNFNTNINNNSCYENIKHD